MHYVFGCVIISSIECVNHSVSQVQLAPGKHKLRENINIGKNQISGKPNKVKTKQGENKNRGKQKQGKTKIRKTKIGENQQGGKTKQEISIKWKTN